jgi:hypothetical protein
MKLFLGAWALVSVAFVLGWGARSAMVADRDPHDARPASSRIGALTPRGLFTRLAGRLALGGVVLAAVGGLAAVGSLPRPVQNVVSAAAERVGIEIPSGDENDTLRLASPSASRVSHVRRRVLSVIDNWEGEKDCEYLLALARAAGASPPQACPRATGGEHETASEPRVASSDEINEQPAAEPPPSLPPVAPSPAPTPTETPSTEPSPAETPPVDPPPEEGPLVDPPPDESPSGEPPP